MKPLIGITSNFMRDIPDTVNAGIAAPNQSWELIAQDYVDSVKKCGGVPVILPVHSAPDECSEILSRVNGLLLSGGNDVSPMLYGERFGAKCALLDPERDEFELKLVRCALEMDMPILGICRGIQVLNVALGGTNIQDLPEAGFQPHCIWSGDRKTGTHVVNILPETPLESIFGKNRIWVNSFHHQAVKTVAKRLKACAVTPEDGIVEGVYCPDRTFVIAVQWHPEMMYDSSLQARIFSAFIKASCE